MPEVRRSDQDRLQIFFLGKHVLIVFIGADLIANFPEVARTLLEVVIPDIAQRDKSDTLDIEKRFQQYLAFFAITDEGNIQGVQRRSVNSRCLLAGVGLTSV